MNIDKILYRVCLLLFSCMLLNDSAAQTVGIRTDRNQILIGERIAYEIRIGLPAPGCTIDLDIPDSIPHFELLDRGNLDTSQTNGLITVHQRLLFTSFDSGVWQIPSFPVTIGLNNRFAKFLTDSVTINVGYSPADSTGALRDIKPIMDVTLKDYFWYYVIGAVLTAIILFLVLYNYLKHRTKKPKPLLHADLSPIEEARRELKKLSGSDLNNQAAVRQYHSALSYIFKRYYSRITGKYLLHHTTSEILIGLKTVDIDRSTLSAIAEALRTGDAVKFAKYMPSANTSESCLREIDQTIESLEKIKSTIS